MIKKISFADVLKLNISERIQLVEDVWDTIAAIPKAVMLTPQQKEELDCRLAAYHKNPSLGSPWNKVKNRILPKI